MFTDRIDAGNRLADLLDDHDTEADIVLAIPRGGLPVGRVIADRLGVPLDVIVARKLRAPDNPELALGAVGGDGTVWLNDSLIEELNVDESYIERQIQQEQEAAREKLERYRGDRPYPELQGTAVLVVDDGIATGATTIACLRQVVAAGADRVMLAAPVAPPDAMERLRPEADEVIVDETPPHFRAVGQFYGSFPQVTDEEARSYLSNAG